MEFNITNQKCINKVAFSNKIIVFLNLKLFQNYNYDTNLKLKSKIQFQIVFLRNYVLLIKSYEGTERKVGIIFSKFF